MNPGVQCRRSVFGSVHSTHGIEASKLSRLHLRAVLAGHHQPIVRRSIMCNTFERQSW